MNKSWRNVVIDGENSSSSSSKSSDSVNSIKSTASNNNNNITTKSSNATIPAAAEADKKRHERLLIVYAPLVGNRVTTFLYDGAIFEGTLDSFVTDGEFALILRMATMIRPGREVIDPSIKSGITFELMNIRFDDMAELKAASSGSNGGGIGTDSAISKKKGDFGRERELSRWVPEDSNSNDSKNFNFNNSTKTNWDQFATNEKLFGLKTDFNEEMYTTKLDRNSPHIRANEAKAERLAREITGASTSNAHLAEERGHASANAHEDEEMLYGAVIRDTLPPGFTGSNTSDLNPNAHEFKLNVNAPEFKPSDDVNVTYYNQPRRNLNYQHQHPQQPYFQPTPGPYYSNGPFVPVPQMPYYYAPPINNNTMNTPHQLESAQVITSTASNTTSSLSEFSMNPNAADFYLPPVQYEEDSGDIYNYYDEYSYQQHQHQHQQPYSQQYSNPPYYTNYQ